MEIDYRRIGRHLRAAREHNNLTQAQVAEIIGVAESSFSNMERGQQKLSLKRIIELCVLYKIKPGSVLDAAAMSLLILMRFIWNKILISGIRLGFWKNLLMKPFT